MLSLEELAGYKSVFDSVGTPQITITYVPGGQRAMMDVGITVGQALRVFDSSIEAIAALVNNEILSLNERLDISSTLEPIPFNGAYAQQIFRDTFTVVLQAAAVTLFRGQALECSYILHGVRYFRFTDMALVEDDVIALRTLLQKLIAANAKITRHVVSYADALQSLKEINHRGSYALLGSMNIPRVPMACVSCKELGVDFKTLWISTLAASTGIISTSLWTIELHDSGVLARLSDDFSTIPPPNLKLEKLLSPLMLSYKDWSTAHRVPNVAALNEIVTSKNHIREFINTCEFRHEMQISEIAKLIPEGVRCIFIAGPSSSSKTTFSNRLAVHLRTRSFEPIRISLDDYYQTPDKVPRLEEEPDKPDFEHLEALDLERIAADLSGLLRGDEVTVAHYDFAKQKPGDGPKIRLPPQGVLVIEGIHALNDRITDTVPESQRCRIFIQPIGSLIWDELRLFESVDNRLIRRMCRDYVFRGRSAEETLEFWPSVRAGEERWILSNQTRCEIYFNSSVLYELFILKVFAVPLLKTVPQSSKNFPAARRLLELLEPFLPVPVEMAPEISLCREFLPSGSIFEDFFF